MAPLPVLIGVFLLLGFGEFVQGMLNAPEQEVGFVVGRGLGQAFGSVLGLVISTLIAGVGVYLFYRYRGRGTTFVGALLSWPVVVIATCIALLSLSLTG
jgi:ABC-type Fe3+ transport system permease subunit